jgi:transposase
MNISPDAPRLFKLIFTAAYNAGYRDIDIARVCGVSPVTVYRWKKLDRNAKLCDLQPLADALGLVFVREQK